MDGDSTVPGSGNSIDDKAKKNRGKKKEIGPIWESFFVLRNRVLAGFVVALPVIITFMIVKWLYDFLAKDVIVYTASWLGQQPLETGNKGVDDVVQASWFVEYVLAPVTAITLIISALFMLGMVFRSRWHRFFNWFMSNVPGVGVIYKSVSNVIDSVRQSNSGTENFQRVVLVKFPHPGIKVPAFVTSSTTDISTGKEILCIYVPTTPIPTSGYMLMVPADEVTEISWGLQETLQAIVSGGITVPEQVEYSNGLVEPKMVQVTSSTANQNTLSNSTLDNGPMGNEPVDNKPMDNETRGESR